MPNRANHTPVRYVRMGALYVTAQEVAEAYSGPSVRITVTDLITLGLVRLLDDPQLPDLLDALRLGRAGSRRPAPTETTG